MVPETCVPTWTVVTACERAGGFDRFHDVAAGDGRGRELRRLASCRRLVIGGHAETVTRREGDSSEQQSFLHVLIKRESRGGPMARCDNSVAAGCATVLSPIGHRRVHAFELEW